MEAIRICPTSNFFLSTRHFEIIKIAVFVVFIKATNSFEICCWKIQRVITAA